MFRILTLLLGWLMLVLGWQGSSAALWPWGSKYLVKIDGKTYTVEDFKRWWDNWKEKDTPFPQSPDPFIEWELLAREAEAMGLQDSPSYKRKLEVFLKVRSLLLLQKEEVTDKVKLTREKLWTLYEKEFVPQVKMRILFSKDQKEVLSWAERLKKGENCAALFEELPQEKKRDLGWQRPRRLPKEFRPAILKASPGEVVGPLKRKDRFVLVCVEDKVGATPNDFKTLLPDLREIARKREEARLTRALLEKLKKKYGVKVRWDLLEKIGLEELPEDLKKEVVLEVADLQLTTEGFQEILKRDARTRYPGVKELPPEKLASLRKLVVENILGETLTDLEALNRHYERREPLKSVWEFYKRQMLVREFENQVIWPQVKITEEEIRRYYEEHRKDYLRPEQVVIAVIQSQDEKFIREVYRRIRSGEDFFEIVKKEKLHGVHPHRFRVDQLVPEMQEVLRGLGPGEVSGIFKVKDYYMIVKLLDRIPASPHPYEMVKESIRKMLRQQKFEELRRQYVEKLRSRVKVEVNQEAWRDLVREYRS